MPRIADSSSDGDSSPPPEDDSDDEEPNNKSANEESEDDAAGEDDDDNYDEDDDEGEDSSEEEEDDDDAWEPEEPKKKGAAASSSSSKVPASATKGKAATASSKAAKGGGGGSASKAGASGSGSGGKSKAVPLAKPVLPDTAETKTSEALQRTAEKARMVRDNRDAEYEYALLHPSKELRQAASASSIDVVKKAKSAASKPRYLFMLPGKFAALDGGEIGTVERLDTPNPEMYLNFPGRGGPNGEGGKLRLRGTLLHPRSKYLALMPKVRAHALPTLACSRLPSPAFACPRLPSPALAPARLSLWTRCPRL